MLDYETLFLVIVIIVGFVILIVALALSPVDNDNIIRNIKHINSKMESYKDLSLVSSNWSNFDAISDINLNNKDIVKVNKLNFDNFGTILTNDVGGNQSITLLSDESFENSFVNINGKLSLQKDDNLCYIHSDENGLNFDIKDSKITFANIDSNYTKMTSSKGILSNSFKEFNEFSVLPEHTYESELRINSINHISIPNNGSKDAIVLLPSTELYNGVTVDVFRSPDNILANLNVQYKDTTVSIISGMNSNKLYKYIYSSKLDKWHELK
jgi:hypothetical protein